MAVQGKDGITILEVFQKGADMAPGDSLLVNMVVLGKWLHSMITEIFFNLNNSVLQGTIFYG